MGNRGIPSLEELLQLPYEEALAQTGFDIWKTSRPWNAHLVTSSRHFHAFVEATARLIEDTEGRKRRPSDAKNAFEAAISALVLDLYSAVCADPDLQIGVNLNANEYGRTQRTRYSNPRLTYRQFKAAFDGLEALEYLEIVKSGWHDSSGKGATTKLKATCKLLEALAGYGDLHHWQITRSLDAEVILLRGAKGSSERGSLLDYEDTVETNRMRESVRYINAVIGEHYIELAISGDKFLDLQNKLASKNNGRALELTRRCLYRVFNDGRFDRGGRFYGGWWQEVPSEYRSFITIDGAPTIEADYSAIHPRLLYAREGLDCPGDPYDLGLDPRHREQVKTALNALINAGPGGIAQPKGYDPEAIGITHKELIDRVREHHEPISKYFYSGIGLELQFADSCMAERVIWHFADKGLPCLPIHDSFLVQQRYSDELVNVMCGAYAEYTGQELQGDYCERLVRVKQSHRGE